MSDKVTNSSFVIVGHTIFPGLTGDLRRYLLDNRCRNLWYLTHDFNNLQTRRSHIEHYRQGVLVDRHYSIDYRFLPEPLVIIKDFLYTIVWMLTRVGRVDLHIGMSGADAACGVLLKRIKRIRSIICYSIDFIPVRFDSWVLNEIYHRVNEFAFKRSTEMWDLSPRMSGGRERVRGLDGRDLPVQRFVPRGIWPDALRYGFEEVNKTELIFIGEVAEKTGVQVVLRAIPRILEELPSFTFRVIGTGAYLDELKSLAEQLGVESHVIFQGLVLDEERVSDWLAHAAVGVALYDREKDDFSYYGDPAKVKSYLSAGLPILLTDLPYNAREIEENGCGLIVEYDPDSVARAVVAMMKDQDRLKQYRENVIDYASRLDYYRLLDENLERLL